MGHLSKPDRGSLRRELAAGLVLLALGVSGTVVAFLTFLAPEPAPRLDPVAAYCHGVNDGWAMFGIINAQALAMAGIPYPEPTEQDYAIADQGCFDGVTGGDLLPGMRGPLLPDEPSD